MSLDPGATQVAIDEGAERLEEAADAVHKAITAEGKAEHAWQRARLLCLAHLYRDGGGKLPAQDIREAVAQQEHSEEWDAYFIAKYQREAVEKSSRLLAAAINARQSLLRARGA